jgi:hypothetical protein
MLALCKFCPADRQMTEVTVSTYLRVETLAYSNHRGLSHVTGHFFGNQWLDLVYVGGFYKVVEEMGVTFGLWSQK